ncbi:MFS transporter [Pseudonocardia aurantiaca]
MADVMPIYPLYALLFTDSGLSGAEVSALFAIWSGVAILTEVPSGALADRFSRRNCLVLAAVFQGAGYAAWMLMPSFAGFALGFVLWGVGGSLVSGAQEALLYDGLADAGAQDRYAQVNGWVTAVQLGAQVPGAVLATSLFATGGYAPAGWASVGVCLAAAFVASRLPEPRRGSTPDDENDEDDAGYFAILRAGLVEAAHRPGVRGVLVAAAALSAFDAVEEYFPLILAGWGLPTAIIPIADLPIVLAGMAGAALAGAASRLGPWALGAVLGVAMLLFGGAGLADHPAGLVAVAVFYGIYRAVLVVVDARLQERLESRSRATVTSVAGVGAEAATFGIYAAWALGEVLVVAVFGLLLAIAVPLLLRAPKAGPDPVRSG